MSVRGQKSIPGHLSVPPSPTNSQSIFIVCMHTGETRAHKIKMKKIKGKRGLTEKYLLNIGSLYFTPLRRSFPGPIRWLVG